MHVLIWSTRRKLRPRLQRKDVERAVEVVRDRCEAKAAVEEAGRATRRGSEGGVTQAAAKEGRGAAQKEEEEEEEEEGGEGEEVVAAVESEAARSDEGSLVHK